MAADGAEEVSMAESEGIREKGELFDSGPTLRRTVEHVVIRDAVSKTFATKQQAVVEAQRMLKESAASLQRAKKVNESVQISRKQSDEKVSHSYTILKKAGYKA